MMEEKELIILCLFTILFSILCSIILIILLLLPIPTRFLMGLKG